MWPGQALGYKLGALEIIVWPGQALGYKLGALEIIELRDKA